MNFSYLLDLVLIVTSVVAVIVVSVSANHKIEIDKKRYKAIYQLSQNNSLAHSISPSSTKLKGGEDRDLKNYRRL